MSSYHRAYCVIRKYKDADAHIVKEIIDEVTMETVGDFFNAAVFSGIFPQISLIIFGISFVFLGVPFSFCLAGIPLAVVFIYGAVYFGHVFKCMELHEDLNIIQTSYMKLPETCFWVAETYDTIDDSPLAVQLNMHKANMYDFINIEHFDGISQNLHGLKRRVVGTVAITRSNKSCNRAWLRRMAVKPDYRRKGIGRQLLETAVQFCEEREEYEAIELVTTECHYKARELYIKRGFEPQQADCKSYLSVRQRIFKLIMPLDQTKSARSKKE